MKNIFRKRVLHYEKYFPQKDFVLWKTFSLRGFCIMENVFCNKKNLLRKNVFYNTKSSYGKHFP